MSYVIQRAARPDADAAFVADATEAATLTRYAMTGGYQAHNTTFATKDAVEIVAEPLAWTRRVEATVPPGETQVYVWSAT